MHGVIQDQEHEDGGERRQQTVAGLGHAETSQPEKAQNSGEKNRHGQQKQQRFRPGRAGLLSWFHSRKENLTAD